MISGLGVKSEVWRVLAIAAIALGLMAVTARSGEAAPVVYSPLPGTADQWIEDLTAGSDGTMWVTQSLSSGTASSENHSRTLHLGPAGNVISATEPIEGSPYSMGLVSAADGGAWEIGSMGRMWHISSDGSMQSISLPKGFGYADGLVSGADGRAWLISCDYVFGDPNEEPCNAIAVSLTGEVQTIALPALTTLYPPGGSGGGGGVRAFATPGGVWLSKRWSVNGSPAAISAEFVSYAGVATAVNVPTDAALKAPGSGDSVWWLIDEGKSGATLGQISPASVISDSHHIGNVSLIDPPDSYIGGVGRTGNLLWAQNATWSDDYDGQIGTARPDGSNTSYMIPHHATDVPTSTPNFWSGSCTFGVRLHEASDGSLWTISGGHPSRITRQQPSGTFETYLLGNKASEFAGEKETGVWGMIETSPTSLYFTLNTPTGPQLARLNPLDPPPAEPRYPGIVRSTTDRGSADRKKQRQRLLRSLLLQTRSSVARLRSGASKPRIRANFYEAGVARILVKQGAGKGTILLSAESSGKKGVHQMTLKVRNAARLLLSSEKRKRAAATVTFDPRSGPPISRSAKIGF